MIDTGVELLVASYDDSVWEKTAVFNESAGYVVTSKQRIARSQINKNEASKYQKEKRMCLRYAGYGFRIEHLSEFPGKRSHDINIIYHPTTLGVAIVNGKKADLKSLKGANNIIKRAKYAIYRQKAELILFEFPTRSKSIENTLRSLSNIGIHGYYYYSDENEYQSF